MNRETWLNDMAALMAPRFAELGHPLPKFRVSIGFPAAGKDGKAAAECWHARNSADGAFQIHIRPDEADAMMIAGHLAHELTHAAVGFECKHKGEFARVVLALGLQRPLTSTVPGPAFKEWVQPFLEELGPIPHAALRWGRALTAAGLEIEGEEGEGEEPDSSNAKPKQSTRMLKAICQHEEDGEQCGYTVRISRKWVDQLGAPCCPLHGPMHVEGMDE